MPYLHIVECNIDALDTPFFGMGKEGLCFIRHSPPPSDDAAQFPADGDHGACDDRTAFDVERDLFDFAILELAESDSFIIGIVTIAPTGASGGDLDILGVAGGLQQTCQTATSTNLTADPMEGAGP